jgi:hypothetical protein
LPAFFQQITTNRNILEYTFNLLLTYYLKLTTKIVCSYQNIFFFSTKSKRSHMTGVTAVSGASTPGKNTTKAGVVIETMSAPNPVKFLIDGLVQWFSTLGGGWRPTILNKYNLVAHILQL